MPKYIKKPVVVEAFQWTGDQNQTDDPFWFSDAIRKHTVGVINRGTPECMLVIKTLEGYMAADISDFIIQGIQGEIYPCKPDIFAQTYELVEEGDS